MVGGPSQMDTVRLQAADEPVVRQGPARLGADGPAAHHHDLGPEAVPDRPFEVQVRPARQVRHVGLRAAPLHVADGRRHVLHPEHAHRGHQPRAGDLLHADGQPDHRPPLPRVLGLLRPRVPQRQPAHVRGPRGQADEHRADPGDLRPAVVVGLPARANMRGSRSAAAATRSSSSTTRRASPPTCGATRSTGSGRSTR